MKSIFIVDIDSTIADNSHRAQFLEKQCAVCLSTVDYAHHSICKECGSSAVSVSQHAWDTFLSPELVAQDSPIHKAIEVLNRIRNLGGQIHFITGRNESLRQVTEEWLEQHANWNRTTEKLIMRSIGERDVPASAYKEAAFLDLQKELSELTMSHLFFFFEDDPYVFSVYNKYGIVLKCPEAWEFFFPKDMVFGEELLRAR